MKTVLIGTRGELAAAGVNIPQEYEDYLNFARELKSLKNKTPEHVKANVLFRMIEEVEEDILELGFQRELGIKVELTDTYGVLMVTNGDGEEENTVMLVEGAEA